MDFYFYRNVILKALVLFLLLNFLMVLLPPVRVGTAQPSLYNVIYPGRERFPFGETPQQAYNFSLYDVDAMFAAHEVSARVTNPDELRIFVMGDSSVWGTLLKPEETLAGQLNTLQLTCGEIPLRFFNLGYPTISLTKDLMLMERALDYDPDMILWLTTLEAFPLEKQLASPLAENNPQRIQPLTQSFDLPLSFPDTDNTWWNKTLWGQRRIIADWLRLQLYGVMWSATGVDQIYPPFGPAAWDLEAGETYYGLTPSTLPEEQLLFQALPAARSLTGDLPLLLVNEPIMISAGANSDLRYNFFYPRWVYDQYRIQLTEHAGAAGLPLVDAWDWITPQEFTNSAIHLTPTGEQLLAQQLAASVLEQICR
jgi:hypothetical protein